MTKIPFFQPKGSKIRTCHFSSFLQMLSVFSGRFFSPLFLLGWQLGWQNAGYRAIFRLWQFGSTESADTTMTCFQAEQESSSPNMAQPRRRHPLLAAPARSELPSAIRRPTQTAAGRQSGAVMSTREAVRRPRAHIKREASGARTRGPTHVLRRTLLAPLEPVGL